MTQHPHPKRCLVISTCYDCPNRMQMHLLYKPYGMMILPQSKEISDYRERWVCSETKDNKEILDDLPDWCPLPHSSVQSERDFCSSFIPNEFYRSKINTPFCVREFCKHWVHERRKCVHPDPSAGSTYNVEEAHCKLRRGKREQAGVTKGMCEK